MTPFLAKRDRLEKADAIVVISGNGFERVAFATQLYEGQFAKKLVLAGTSGSRPAPEMAQWAVKEGVPETDIVQELSSRNTKANAANVLKIALREKWRKIILVTSPHHQLRAYLTFKKAWSGSLHTPKIINYPPIRYSWFDWIESGRDKNRKALRLFYFFSEWYKILQYSLKGDL